MTALNPHPARASIGPKKDPRLLSQLFGFRTRLYLTWAGLFGLCVMFFMSFDLKFSIILDKWPNLVGLHLGPNGFLQGAASDVVSVLLFDLAVIAPWLRDSACSSIK